MFFSPDNLRKPFRTADRFGRCNPPPEKRQAISLHPKPKDWGCAILSDQTALGNQISTLRFLWTHKKEAKKVANQ